MYRRIVLLLVTGLALSACASTSMLGPVKPVPPQFIDMAMNAAFAETISEQCSRYRYDEKREARVRVQNALVLVEGGYTERDMRAWINNLNRDNTIRQKAVRMILERRIDVTSEASWCAAGKREKAQMTDIGKYLI